MSRTTLQAPVLAIVTLNPGERLSLAQPSKNYSGARGSRGPLV
jgi:hypothetical protein